MTASLRRAFLACVLTFAAAPAMAQPLPSPDPTASPAASPSAPEPKSTPLSTAVPTPTSAPSGAAAVSPAAALNALFGAAGAGSSPQPYAAFVRNAERERGLIDLIKKDDELYFDFAPEQLAKTYVFAPSLASGLGAATYAGRLYEPLIVEFKRVGKRILWISPNTEFIAGGGTPTARSLAISTADSIIAATPILAEDPVTKRIVIAPTLFLSDYLEIGKDLARAAGGTGPGIGGLLALLGGSRGGFGLDATRSYYVKTKTLPNNVEVTVNLTFSGNGSLQTVPDTRGTPIRVHYSIVEEPHDRDGYVPRLADDRIGYFIETQKRFGDDTLRTPFVRYIDRWDLSRGPIVFTMTNEIPAKYRAAVKRGILEWNRAFAKIGHPNALSVVDAPVDANFDPDDIHFNPVRWITQDRSSFAAATPHISDPRTGRILRAVVTVDGEVLRSLRRGYVTSVAPTRSRVAFGDPHCAGGTCDLAEAFAAEAALGIHAMTGIRENSPETDRYVEDYVASVVTHEVGHALGLRHNFAAARIYTLRQVHDPAFTAVHGLAGSVMDYTPVNLSPFGKPQADYFQKHVGPYDDWAIEYGYRPFAGVKTPSDEIEPLRRIADRSTDPLLAYETDEDAGGFWGADPRVAVFTLSSDPLGYNEERFQINDRLVRTLDKRLPRDDRSYYDERMAFLTIMGSYDRSAISSARWVGGVYVSRAHRGQRGATAPFRPVPRAQQKRAFDLLDRYVLSSRAFRFAPGLIERLGPDNFHGWGGQGLAARPDFPLSEFVASIQDDVIDHIFTPPNIARIHDQALLAPGVTMSLADLFEWSRKAVYDDIASGTPIAPLHRELQRRNVGLMVSIAMLPSAAVEALLIPYETQSLARHLLIEVRKDARRGLRSGKLDGGTRAHLEDLEAHVGRALAAGNLQSI